MKDMIEEAKKWAAEREHIFNVEAETGVLDHDAIQGNDDDAVEFAMWIAAGMPGYSPVLCAYCGETAHEPGRNCGGCLDGKTWKDPYKLTGDYGTFEITKVVYAIDEVDAFEQTGIMTDLEAMGWEMSSVDGEEWTVEAIKFEDTTS